MLQPDAVSAWAAIHSADQQFRQTCASGDLTAITALLNASPQPARRLTEGLEAATYSGHQEAVSLLLDQGAIIDGRVQAAAITAKSIAIFELLTANGLDINTPIFRNETLLLHTLQDDDLVKWFLDHGANVNPAPELNHLLVEATPVATSSAYLNRAAGRSSIQVFNLLLQHGAQKEGSVALHMASGTGDGEERIPMMAHLISLGYDVNEMDETRGNFATGTPLQYAIKAKSLSKVKFLLQNGADPRKPGGLAGSPLNLAERFGMREILDLLENPLAS